MIFVFWGWLDSLNMIFPTFIHFPAKDTTLLFFLAEKTQNQTQPFVCVGIDHTVLTRPSAAGHQGLFHGLPVGSTAAVTMMHGRLCDVPTCSESPVRMSPLSTHRWKQKLGHSKGAEKEEAR